LAIDVDRFHDVNARHGQDGGDRLLRELALRLKACVRSTDFVARIGADEFGVLVLPGDGGDTDTGPVLERIESMLSHPMDLGGDSVWLTVSLGIAQAAPGQRADEVLAAAFAALSAAKARGNGGRAVFDERLAAAEKERTAIAAELRDALRKGELVFVYQPAVWLRSEELFGIDAGFRWSHPKRGRLDAAAVIAIADEAGASDRLTWWMLEEVSRVAKTWEARLGQRPLTVHVSARHAVNGLVPLVNDLLEGTQLPSGGLVLEVTGAKSFPQTGALADAVAQLRDAGVKVAIDDLHKGSVKADLALLDRMLIERCDTDAQAADTVHALIDLAHTVGAMGVADGVSRDSQAELLRAAGCEIGRGSYFGGAISKERLETALNLLGDAAPQRLAAGGMRVRPLD
jgi:diguanylate cyclase (GGDEF)-like protein